MRQPRGSLGRSKGEGRDPPSLGKMATPKANKMLQLINYRMRVTLQDARVLVGRFMAFDKHMNIVLGDCEEFRKVVPKGKKEEHEEKRTLGLTLIRGENVVSLSVEGPPPKDDTRIKVVDKAETGPGSSAAAGRGMRLRGGGWKRVLQLSSARWWPWSLSARGWWYCGAWKRDVGKDEQHRLLADVLQVKNNPMLMLSWHLFLHCTHGGPGSRAQRCTSSARAHGAQGQLRAATLPHVRR